MDPLDPRPDLSHVVDILRDALADLEVWRQNARTSEEWTALRRVALGLDAAQRELTEGGAVRARPADPAQRTLLSA